MRMARQWSLMLDGVGSGHGDEVTTGGMLSRGKLQCPDLPLTYTSDVGVRSPTHSQCGFWWSVFSSV